MDIIETIKEQIANNTILLYMKGSPNAPQCGFSAKAAQAVMGCGEKFAYVDILQNPEIRANLPKYANWPTFPQLWVAGELVGGSDIMAEMFANGELQSLIKPLPKKPLPRPKRKSAPAREGFRESTCYSCDSRKLAASTLLRFVTRTYPRNKKAPLS